MRDARQVFWGIITALVSIALLLGVFSLSMAEGSLQKQTPTLQPTITLSRTYTLTWQPSASHEKPPTPLIVTPTWTSTGTPTWTPSWTPSLPASPTSCHPPLTWLPYIVQMGDTLDGLAARYKITSLKIIQANCLETTEVLPGMLIYLPTKPTQTTTPCGAPRTWVIYIVQHGDTLYHLGQAYGIPYTDIQHANCLTSSILRDGQRLYVPPWATRTPSPTFPSIFIPSDTPTETVTADTSIPPGGTETAAAETVTETRIP